MIEVRQRNSNGVIQFIGTYTEFEFSRKYGEDSVRELFSNTDTDNRFWSKTERVADSTRPGGCRYQTTCGNEFKHTAYNSRGKLLTVDYLVGVTRACNRAFSSKWIWNWRRKEWVKRQQWAYHPGHKRTNGRYYRRIQTTNERRWAHAWDDEEVTPKYRAARNAKNLPNSWDDYRIDSRYNHNWKRYRKHQWKEKNER